MAAVMGGIVQLDLGGEAGTADQRHAQREGQQGRRDALAPDLAAGMGGCSGVGIEAGSGGHARSLASGWNGERHTRKRPCTIRPSTDGAGTGPGK
jgi:hypothetical protein